MNISKIGYLDSVQQREYESNLDELLQMKRAIELLKSVEENSGSLGLISEYIVEPYGTSGLVKKTTEKTNSIYNNRIQSQIQEKIECIQCPNCTKTFTADMEKIIPIITNYVCGLLGQDVSYQKRCPNPMCLKDIEVIGVTNYLISSMDTYRFIQDGQYVAAEEDDVKEVIRKMVFQK